VIVPAYNEADRLGDSLRRIADWARRGGRTCEIIVVDDGSTDSTTDAVRQFAAAPKTVSGTVFAIHNSQKSKHLENGKRFQEPFFWLAGPGHRVAVRLLVNGRNRGKGFSVRRGMLDAAGEVLLFTDADLSAPIEEADKLRARLDRGCDVAIGSRAMPDSRVDPPRTWKRRLMAWTFHRLRRRLLPGPLGELGDTQCGLKCFTRRAGREIFARVRTDGFAFDCEALAIALRLGWRVREVGVAWSESGRSRFRPVRDSARMLASLFAIRRRLREPW